MKLLLLYTHYEASLSVVGEKGYAVIGGIALNKIDTWNFVNPILEDIDIPQQYSVDVPSGYGLSHKMLLEQTIQSILDEKYISVDLDSCISTCELIHGLYSSHENQEVKLKDKPLSKFLGGNHWKLKINFQGKMLVKRILLNSLVAKKFPDHKSKFEISNVEFGGDKVPIFAGPNMIESHELILNVAENIKKSGADF